MSNRKSTVNNLKDAGKHIVQPLESVKRSVNVLEQAAKNIVLSDAQQKQMGSMVEGLKTTMSKLGGTGVNSDFLNIQAQGQIMADINKAK